MKEVLSNRLVQRSVAIGLTAGVALSARADGVDVSAVTTAITAAGVAIGTVGAAYLAMRVGGKVFKWIQTAL
jgi:uncharacterized membrane protein YfcA